jgi:cobalt-precorrin-5B (C1)-methyltransferase
MTKTANILLFGGTTEGKAAANWLNDMGFSYHYSTKTPTSFRVHEGCQKLEQAMTTDDMMQFCRAQQINLIVDAAHPFAKDLHSNIHRCAHEQGIPHLRVERSFGAQSDSPQVHYVASLEEMTRHCHAKGYTKILSLMGVKSVGTLHRSLPERKLWYRILDRPLSWFEALNTGVEKQQVIASLQFDNLNDADSLIEEQGIEALLTKDSGHIGLIDQKIELAEKYQIPLIIMERPVIPEFTKIAKCRADLRQYMEANYVLPKSDLAHGYTTGTCATICARAAATLLISGLCDDDETVSLPDGALVSMPIHTSDKEQDSAYATVIKNSGDDPDLTDGMVIGCRIRYNETGSIRFVQGEGVGTVRLPGLGLPIGGPAINKVPRQMISHELQALVKEYDLVNASFDVEVFIPQGKRLAEKTFNPRLGIEGGLSIIGSTGRIKPFSSEAYVASIVRQLDVVKDNKATEVVFNSGGRSERYLKKHFSTLPSHSFVQYGNYIGEALKVANGKSIERVSMGIMTGKAVKLAAGNLDTHSRKVVMDKAFISHVVKEAGYSDEQLEKVEQITMARELETLFPFEAEEPFFKLLKQKCEEVARREVKDFELNIILINNEGKLLV